MATAATVSSKNSKHRRPSSNATVRSACHSKKAERRQVKTVGDQKSKKQTIKNTQKRITTQ
jgi:hypothetical protein